MYFRPTHSGVLIWISVSISRDSTLVPGVWPWACTRLLVAGPSPIILKFAKNYQLTRSLGTGDAKNVSMLIDSGAAYTSITDPTIYKPSPNATSINQTHPDTFLLNRTHWNGYGQVLKNGCGGLYYWCDIHTDTVTWQGLTMKYQRFLVADYTNLHFKEQVAQIPRKW